MLVADFTEVVFNVLTEGQTEQKVLHTFKCMVQKPDRGVSRQPGFRWPFCQWKFAPPAMARGSHQAARVAQTSVSTATQTAGDTYKIPIQTTVEPSCGSFALMLRCFSAVFEAVVILCPCGGVAALPPTALLSFCY